MVSHPVEFVVTESKVFTRKSETNAVFMTRMCAGVRVLAVASGRNHMACIGEAGGPAASFVNRGLGLGQTGQ
jgi:hypothetical protein